MFASLKLPVNVKSATVFSIYW